MLYVYKREHYVRVELVRGKVSMCIRGVEGWVRDSADKTSIDAERKGLIQEQSGDLTGMINGQEMCPLLVLIGRERAAARLAGQTA